MVCSSDTTRCTAKPLAIQACQSQKLNEILSSTPNGQIRFYVFLEAFRREKEETNMFLHTSVVIQSSNYYVYPFSKRAVLRFDMITLHNMQNFLCLGLSRFHLHFVFRREQNDVRSSF